MPIKSIKVGSWYETTAGIGICEAAGGTHPPSVRINITKPFPKGTIYLSPRDVKAEVIKPEA